FDTDVTFKAWIRLSVDGGNVHVEVARTQQAGDTLSDVLDLFSGGYITRLLENAIPKAVGSVGGGAFAQVAMFADNLPSDKYAASATASGSIRIYANGLGIPVEITARQAPERLKPAYLHGHVVSREFHVTGCQYGDVIRGSNLRRFVSWQQAIASGFNGCATCQPQYNVAVEGRVRIELTGPPPSADHRPLKLTASYAGSAKRFGVPLGPLSVEFRFTGVQSSSGDVVYAASADGLVPGPWSFSVEWRDWSKAQTVEVARSWNDSAGQRQGHSTFIAGTLGDANLTVTHR
ncbi:MAG TPA: hypothetical protein VFV66_28020, partial [Nonomuraea sp.]|nr:hypothetical protein [Nonomuraea sp.]